MESAGTPTELPSPTPLAAEAWPATAAAAAGMAGGAGIAGRGCRHPCSNPRAVLAVDFPDLEFTTHDQEAHEANTKLASELKASIENKLIEIGIWNFWNTPNLANDSARTQWQYMMKLPALSRCRCLQAMQARLDAMEIPEGLQNRCSDPHAAQESANTFRKAAEKLSEEMQLLSLAGEGLPPAEDKAADKDVHRPNGSEHDDDDDSDAINNPFEVDYDSDSDSILLPFNSPFHRAIEFGITEKTLKTSTFLGLPELVDAEEIVPALRLDLKTATEVEVEIAIADGLSRLEEKYVFCFF